MEVPVINMQGVEVGRMTIDEAALGGEVNPALIKQAYVRYHGNQRQGSSRTKNRREVEGSTRKLYKQKHTGRARRGDRKTNLLKGGGHAHSKKRTREDYRSEMPVKMRRKANRSALLAKLIDNEVRVIDALAFPEAKTRAFVAFLEAAKIDRSALLAVPSDQGNVRLAARNVPSVTTCRPSEMTCYELLNHRYLIISRADLEAWLAGPWSQTDKSAKLDPQGRRADTGGTGTKEAA